MLLQSFLKLTISHNAQDRCRDCNFRACVASVEEIETQFLKVVPGLADYTQINQGTQSILS